MGIKFEGKPEKDEGNNVIIKDKITNDKEKLIKYELKGTCEFTSDRRMSSAIYYDRSTQKHFVYTKGADSEIKKVLD